MHEQNENINKEKKIFWKQTLELWNVIMELKNPLQAFNNGLDQSQEIINKLKDRSFKLCIRRVKRKKKKKNEKEKPKEFWDSIQRTIMKTAGEERQ